MRIKVDEDLPRAVVHVLLEHGHDACSVSDQRMGGFPDVALWKAVQAEQRFLVTADKGFGDIRSYAPGTHAGVLLLRPDEDGIRPVMELLRQVLDSFDLQELSTTVSVATPGRTRIRRAPG